jgi:hypothetical protein
VYLHIHSAVADVLDTALPASIETTAGDPDWQSRVREFVKTRLEVVASDPTFLAQVQIEPQLASAAARKARRDAAYRLLDHYLRLARELAESSSDVAALPEHVALAGMAAGVTFMGAVAPEGPDAVRRLEDPLTDIWIRLLRKP